MTLTLTISDDCLPCDGKDSSRFLIEALIKDPKFFVLAADEIKAVTPYGFFTETR